MFKRIVLSAAFVGLFCFVASDAMAGHGHRGHGWGHGGWGNTAFIGHGHRWHAAQINRRHALYHHGPVGGFRYYGRPLYYNSFYGGGWGPGWGYGGYGCNRSGVSVRFGW